VQGEAPVSFITSTITPPRPDHHHRAEAGVVHRPKDQLDSRARHRLHRDTLEPRRGTFSQQDSRGYATNAARTSASFARFSSDAADLGLVADVG